MFKQTFPTPKECSKWTNKCKYIILHHTGTWDLTIKWVLDWLNRRDDYASCHFVIDVNWDIYKIWKPEDILWHCWESQWKWYKDMNRYSIWIEVIWPWEDKAFSFEQKVAVKTIIRHLMKVYWIPQYNVLRHKDIAPWRKTDIADSFWNEKYKTWWEYQRSL